MIATADNEYPATAQALTMPPGSGFRKEMVFPFSGGGKMDSCYGCRFCGVDKYGQANCAHPFFVELYEVPQYMGEGQRARAGDVCPDLASDRQLARIRARHKAEKIFWEYRGDADRRYPYREGFFVPRFYERTSNRLSLPLNTEVSHDAERRCDH